MTATATTTRVYGKGFEIVLPAFDHDVRHLVAYGEGSLDVAGDETAVAAFKTKAGAAKRVAWENEWNASHETGVRFEVREVEVEGRVYFLAVDIYTWPEPEQAPAAVPCTDCGEVVDIEETITAGHGHRVCPKSTSRYMTGHRVPREAVSALEKRQRWEAHRDAQQPFRTTCAYCEAEIEDQDENGWVDALSGDQGGTFDYCPGSPEEDFEDRIHTPKEA